MTRHNPDFIRLNRWFHPFMLLGAIIIIIQPVLAEAGTVSVSYRGAGGYTIGDVITFDGKNTAGNITLLKITGPGLPDAGVPVSNLDGNPGSVGTIAVDADSSWKYEWYSARSAGIEKMMTARYTIIAADLTRPEKMASATILMKKPEFYVNPLKAAIPGDYVELAGIAERDVTYLKIDIADAGNRIVHTFIAPVSATGSFTYGFRIDMQPGVYMVRISNPSLEDTLTHEFTVVHPAATNTTEVTVPALTLTSPNETTPVAPAPSMTQSAPLSPCISVVGLVLSVLVILTGKREK